MILLFILNLYMHLYFLDVDYISYPTCCEWTPTPLWCILAEWGRLIVVGFPRVALEPTRRLPLSFGVLSSGAMTRIVWGLLCSYWIIYRTLSFIVDDVSWDMIFDVIMLCFIFPLWSVIYMIDYVWMNLMKSNTLKLFDQLLYLY